MLCYLGAHTRFAYFCTFQLSNRYLLPNFFLYQFVIGHIEGWQIWYINFFFFLFSFNRNAFGSCNHYVVPLRFDEAFATKCHVVCLFIANINTRLFIIIVETGLFNAIIIIINITIIKLIWFLWPASVSSYVRNNLLLAMKS